LGVSRRAFPRNARSHRASRSVREAAKGGSRETRDAPGDASVASVDVSVLGRSVTRAWRDDSVIFARLRPSAPQMVESWLAARLRGEERRASAPGVCRVCPLDRRRRARRGARRRATRRDGRTCAPARRGVCGREARADEGEGARERLREEEAQTSRNASILGTDDDTGNHVANRREYSFCSKTLFDFETSKKSLSVFSVARKSFPKKSPDRLHSAIARLLLLPRRDHAIAPGASAGGALGFARSRSARASRRRPCRNPRASGGGARAEPPR